MPGHMWWMQSPSIHNSCTHNIDIDFNFDDDIFEGFSSSYYNIAPFDIHTDHTEANTSTNNACRNNFNTRVFIADNN